MTLENIYFIAEIIAAVALVASLVFVGLQVRANTREHRLASLNMRSEKWAGLNADISSDPVLRDILIRGSASFSDLSRSDAMAFGAFWTRFCSFVIDVATQRDMGAIDESVWQNFKTGFRIWCRAPGVKQWWRKSGPRHYAAYPRAILEDVFGPGTPKDAVRDPEVAKGARDDA